MGRQVRSTPWLIFLAVVAVTGVELLADFRPFRWIWWTHKQAMDFGGLALVALTCWLLLRREV
jgi:hypothetical protein